MPTDPKVFGGQQKVCQTVVISFSFVALFYPSGSISAMDSAIGKIVEALELNQMTDDTIIVFTSDVSRR